MDTYFLHGLHREFIGFHSLIPFLKATTIVNSFNSKGTISQILGPKYEILSLPLKQILRLALQNLNWFVNYNLYDFDISLIMEGNIFRHTLNISVANICRFLVCIATDLSCSNSFFKDDDLSPYNRHKHLSCRRLILFIIRLWNIQIRDQ